MSEIIKSIVFTKPKSKVFHIIPWNSDKNIGESYNDSMSLVNSDDWVCFLDGDAIHTTSFFGKRIEDVINNNPEYSLFTCYTNRIGFPPQIAPNVNRETNDQKYHREFGENLWNKNGTSVLDVTNHKYISGVLLLINKKVWEKVGGFKTTNMLGVDNDIHRRVSQSGGKVGLMKGIYVQHWYRGGDNTDTKHLK
jgi:GT2 family glycosyltransferase